MSGNTIKENLADNWPDELLEKLAKQHVHCAKTITKLQTNLLMTKLFHRKLNRNTTHKKLRSLGVNS